MNICLYDYKIVKSILIRSKKGAFVWRQNNLFAPRRGENKLVKEKFHFQKTNNSNWVNISSFKFGKNSGGLGNRVRVRAASQFSLRYDVAAA
jgi:hypothetical protein